MRLQLTLFFCISFFSLSSLHSQSTYWQQDVKYKMDIQMNVNHHQFSGIQEITYTNNSPDDIKRIFYHLYLNAFQPNSMMDVRSRTIADADGRVGDRIAALEDSEIGYHQIESLTQDGMATSFITEGTVLEVNLPKIIHPGESAVLKMKFSSQVPIQIRRTGRDNSEGISYSMSQWYPKLAEYDEKGWHANPYVGREFHGVWGDFDVKITIDSDYIVAASGYLQNPKEVGAGYATGVREITEKTALKTYHFIAPNVHDFVWAADPDYTHTIHKRSDGMKMHFFYQAGEKTTENWEKLPAIMDKAFGFINEHFGQYPYDKYSFIQGGDGGMEYAMATLITGNRPLSSLVGVSVHELLHSWYQMVLASNESTYPWMDEGFTSYASNVVMNYLRAENLIPGDAVDDPHNSNIIGFVNFVNAKMDEPLSTHADHFTTNAAYGVGSYVKGSLFLYQLQYILGKDVFEAGMLTYFDTWKFKHPDANDFIRTMEKESGMVLDWYKDYFINTQHLADYGITGIEANGRRKSILTLEKIGVMPMPLDITVTLKNDKKIHYTIPLRMMRGVKKSEGSTNYQLAPDWPWTHPTYELLLDIPMKKITRIEIDASGRMIDTNRDNNTFIAE